MHLRFFTAESRCATSVDRWLMNSVAVRIDPRIEIQPNGAASESHSFDLHEEDIREWATYAIARGYRVDMTDQTALLESVAAAEERLYWEALEHIGSVPLTEPHGERENQEQDLEDDQLREAVDAVT
jgi:hypothetical protein